MSALTLAFYVIQLDGPLFWSYEALGRLPTLPKAGTVYNVRKRAMLVMEVSVDLCKCYNTLKIYWEASPRVGLNAVMAQKKR